MRNLWCLLLVVSYSVFGQEKSKVISENITSDTHWSHDTTYVLDGRIYVANSAVLTIDSGTVIKGKAGEGASASMLIIARNSQIIAEGTREFPIIFTSIADDIYFDATVMRHVGTNNMGPSEQGFWGGVVILGNAQGSFPQAQNETVLEGFPATENLAYYGGDTNEESSGVLRYVSIRHGGANVGAGNEIGSLTLGAVGELTEIDHVEVYAGMDDGLDIYGGNVNIKHAILDEIGDDAVDYDQGYLGYMQFIYVAQTGDAAIEADGGEGEEVEGQPVFYNFTVMDTGSMANQAFDVDYGLIVGNSVVKGFTEEGFILNDDAYNYMRGVSTKATFRVENTIFDDVADGTPAGVITTKSFQPGSGTVITDHFNEHNNAIEAVFIFKNYPVPPAGTANNGVPSEIEWFEPVTYQGAFEPFGEQWSCEWTRSQPDCVILSTRELNVKLDIKIFPNPATQTVQLTANFTGTIELYGIQGQLVKQFSLSNNNSLDVTDLAPGSYVLVGYSAQGNFSQALVIE